MTEAWFRPRPDGWRDPALGLLLALIYLMLLLGTVSDLGYARDEGFYFHAASRYQAWFELLVRDPGDALARVDEFWNANPEHPAVIKILFALSHWVAWDGLHLFAREGTSYRFPAMVLAGLGVGLTYLWGARALGRFAGVVAAVSLGAMPQVFHHAHLACFDIPIVTLWAAAAYAYWRALDRGGARRVLLAGVIYGLALGSKHNAWFLPVVLALHLGALALAREGAALRRGAAALAAMLILGPAIVYATWPWLWHETGARLAFYTDFQINHVYYNMEFLGRNYFEPPMPRTYALVMTTATVPATTLACFATGVGVALRAMVGRVARRDGRDPTSRLELTYLLWLLAIAVQYGAWLLPTTPIYGGTKHWMTAYPFLALLAGVGAQRALLGLFTAWPALRGDRAAVAFASAVLTPSAVQAAHVHPWGLASYTPLVGGAQGAASLGLNRSFWGYTTAAAVPFLEREAPKRGRIYLHDTALAAWNMYQRDGWLRGDLQPSGQLGDSDIALYHHELHMLGVEYQAWVALGTTTPSYIAGHDGVPVIWLYQRKIPRR
jgi:4-amino-4-deoxy-L-arabinose transferase-like glycosyltransferase